MIEHLSYSSISTYLMCPRSWRFRYIDKVKAPTSPALAFGSAFHEAVEERVRNNNSPPGTWLSGPPTIGDLWRTAWGKQIAKTGIDWDGDLAEDQLNDLYWTGDRMFSDPDIIGVIDGLRTFHEPQSIERRIELTVPGVDVPVIGFIDIIEHDGIPGDFKTASRAWSRGKEHDELQPSFYLAAMLQAGHTANPDLAFRYYIFTKTKAPRVQVLETTRTVGEIFWLYDLIKEVWEAIKAGAFPPNPGTWKCSPRWCEYWSSCRGKS